MRTRLVLAVVLALAGAGTTATSQTISIQLDGTTFKVIGWLAPSAPPPNGWAPVFAVYVDAPDVPPLLGSYSVEQRVLMFRPQYPLSPGVRYRAVFNDPAGRRAIEQRFDGPPKNTTPRTRVERIYPSSDVLPSNQLRLYLYFSAPMSRGEAARRIHLLDEGGHELTDEFLPGEELWDPNMQRLTLTFDPGRIKRGLTSNQKIGPPLMDGQRYTLAIDREWPDAQGVPLVDGYRKTFRGGPAMRTAPNPRLWKITTPRAGTSDPLIVQFDRPMNYPLLQRMLEVRGRDRLAGAFGADRQETEWRFTPFVPWPAGSYRLIVDTRLEDLAGNSVEQPFDIDVFERVTEHITTRTVDVSFSVR